MTRKLTAAMLVLMWVVSALLAWQVMAATTQSDPLTATVHVNVGKWQDTNPTQLYAELDDFAQAHHMTIARACAEAGTSSSELMTLLHRLSKPLGMGSLAASRLR